MSELTLSRDERLRLKADSHHLEPVVLLGAHGLTEGVFKEIDRALVAHELVKVRTPALDRPQRELMFQQVAERLGAARIQLIGRLMVLFRPAPKDPRPRARAPAPVPKAKRPAASPAPRGGDKVGRPARAPFPARSRRPGAAPLPQSGKRTGNPRRRPAQT